MSLHYLVRSALCTLVAASAAAGLRAAEPGLLFHLSGEQKLTADFAASGEREPTITRGVEPIADGAKGTGFQCEDTQLLAYWAPGNVYAERGTLSFFWRSRYPVGPTEFPVFRVSFADNTSWDMTWLRIDYNGHGFDAFVTDASLARTRVSAEVAPFPEPKIWTHIAFSWDATRGVRLYVNGRLAASKDAVMQLNVGLDQFGPHSRIISPHQVQSAYNFTRGGDVDEIRIYDRMLDDAAVATLAKGEAVTTLESLPARSVRDSEARAQWWFRHGWDQPQNPPAYLAGDHVSIRKVEIHETYDIKRWHWKGTDGIRETTWPGVYNRSRLPGRTDYFILPDWDTYADGGKAITLVMPNEPWNHIEIAGSAWGKMEQLPAGTNGENGYAAPAESTLFERAKGHERTTHRSEKPATGGLIRFTNVEAEEPIGELGAYNVSAGREPQGEKKLSFRIGAADTGSHASLAPMVQFLERRYQADERALLVAQPSESATPVAKPPTQRAASSAKATRLPVAHVLIPNVWDAIDAGLDGIAIDLPALSAKPTHGDLIPLNLQVKDPSWLYRNALDFSFSVKPGEAKTLWLDLRDRVLPQGKSFFLTLACASEDFDAALLEGAQLRLVFKPREAARAEHEIDRFTQVRDNFAMMAEERPRVPRLNLWNRFHADLTELLRVNPDHELGKHYAFAVEKGPRPPAKFGKPPVGVPLWAFRQVELLARYQRFVNWYVDHRQAEYGDFGGGLSDDTDFSNLLPGLAMMGADPEKFRVSLNRLVDACYKNGIITNGLCTIQTDDLHSFEEGLNALAQAMLLDYGSPRQIERAFDNVRGVNFYSDFNASGHRHVKSFYFSGTRIATEEPWAWSKPNCYLIVQPTELLHEFSGHPAAKKIIVELADGLLAHRKVDPATGRGTYPFSIRFSDDAEAGASGYVGGGGGSPTAFLFWSAWTGTNDRKYLEAVLDHGYHSVNANLLDILDLRKTVAATLRAEQGNEPASSDLTGFARSGSAPQMGGRGGRDARNTGKDLLSWQLTGDKQALVNAYDACIEEFDAKEYIFTHGSIWIDRTFGESSRSPEIQKTRLGGVVHDRNDKLSGHVVSWKFDAPATAQSAAFLIPNATPTGFNVIAYNLETKPVRVTMTGWNIDPGVWEISQGIDTNNDDVADADIATRTVPFERTESVELTLPPRASTVLTLKLKTPGVPYWQRPDLGLDREDVRVANGRVDVTVHSVGAVAAPASRIELRDTAGRVLAKAAVPALDAPLDLQPKTATVSLEIPAGASTTGARVVIVPSDAASPEITRRNNETKL